VEAEADVAGLEGVDEFSFSGVLFLDVVGRLVLVVLVLVSDSSSVVCWVAFGWWGILRGRMV
jgi:hypothetical protein